MGGYFSGITQTKNKMTNGKIYNFIDLRRRAAVFMGYGLGLIFSDLWAGVRKAKKAGVYRTSDGYKKTIDKMARYYNMMLPLAMMDTIETQ